MNHPEHHNPEGNHRSCNSTRQWPRSSRAARPASAPPPRAYDRSLDHRRLPHPARHRQAGQGRAGRHAPAAPGATVLKALAERNNLNTAEVDDIIWGTSHPGGGRAATWAAWRRSTPATTSLQRRHAGPLLRFGHHHGEPGRRHDHVGHGRPGHRRRLRDDVDDRRHRAEDGPPFMDAGNLRLRAKHPQSHQGVCADAIATMEGIPREALDALALRASSAPRCHRRRPLRQEPDPGVQGRRHAGARPRGVPAPADHR
jgi:hypothetical protein